MEVMRAALVRRLGDPREIEERGGAHGVLMTAQSVPASRQALGSVNGIFSRLAGGQVDGRIAPAP